MTYAKLLAMGTAILVTAAGSALLAPIPAVAAPVKTANDDAQAHIQYSDLDLTSLHGQRILRARARQAVTDMCGSGAYKVGIAEGPDCRSATMNDLEAQMVSAIKAAREAGTKRSSVAALGAPEVLAKK